MVTKSVYDTYRTLLLYECTTIPNIPNLNNEQEQKTLDDAHVGEGSLKRNCRGERRADEAGRKITAEAVRTDVRICPVSVTLSLPHLLRCRMDAKTIALSAFLSSRRAQSGQIYLVAGGCEKEGRARVWMFVASSL